MGFFTSLLTFKRKATQVSSSTEFNNSACKCVQQELDISETTWVDTTPYENAKKALKAKSRETMNISLKSKDQRDLFESF
jgi:hypothetical protein